MGLLKSMMGYKCPRCRQGDTFVKPLDFGSPLNMHKRCKVCALDLEPEPGYYWGAFFISYILSGWFLLIPALTLVFVFGWSSTQAFLLVVFLGALTYLFFLRFSRSVWLYITVKYDPDVITKINKL